MTANISNDASMQVPVQLPMQIVAQLERVTVFQTAASDIETNDPDISSEVGQTIDSMLEQGHASYGLFNLGLHVNDDAAQVLSNRMSLLSAINEQLADKQLNDEPSIQASAQNSSVIKRLHWVNQIHGKQIHDIDTTPLSMTPLDADAMLSCQAGLGLAIMTADCVPIVLYQPLTGQIAAIHAGWQGLACGVIKTTVSHFDPTHPILAWVGVCISQANYEVGPQVCDKLLAGCRDNQLLTASSLNSFIQSYVITVDADAEMSTANQQDILVNQVSSSQVAGGKLKLNLPELAIDQLSALGISVSNELPIACSYGDNRYYSYRRQTHLQQRATGRMALIIVKRA